MVRQFWNGLIAASALGLVLGGCSMFSFGGDDMVRESTTLNPADAATSLIAGGPLVMARATPRAASEESDAVVMMILTRQDGRHLSFMEANHAPYDVMAQAAGGPLASAMGLFGEEIPVLYARQRSEDAETPFICGAEGPAYLGYYRDEAGSVTVVGLRSAFEFEPLANGGYTPMPYSPDHVCARMKFTAQ